MVRNILKSDSVLRVMTLIVALVMFGGDTENARERVKEGVAAFQKRDYSNAARAFADADLLVPNDLTIKFNRGCAEARIHNRKDAKRLLTIAASSNDRKIALAANYNLGTIEVTEAIQKFGESPQSLKEAERKRAVAHLTNAVKHFRVCLSIDPNHTDARRNIEVIRLWHANMRKLWKRHEETKQEQKKEEKTLPQVLAELDAAQFKAFDTNSSFASNAEPTLEELQSLQKAVEVHVPIVEKKLDAMFKESEGVSDEQRAAMNQVQESFMSIHSAIEDSTTNAISQLADGERDSALDDQAAVLKNTNQLLELISQFPDAVQRSVSLQQPLVDRILKASLATRTEPLTIERGNSLLERQTRVAGLTANLSDLAEVFRQMLEQQQQTQVAGQSRGMPPDQLAGYQTAIDRALELNEELQQEINSSLSALEVTNREDAEPHATRVLEILKKIAETLPKQGNGDGNEDQQQQNEDQNNDENKQQDQQSEKGEEGDENEQEQQEEGEDKSQQQEQKKSEQEKREIRSREEAEALLRQVRDREQKLKDLKAKLRAIRAGGSKVKRDW